MSTWGVVFNAVDRARAAEPAVGGRQGETADHEPVRRRRVLRVHDQADVPIEPLIRWSPGLAGSVRGDRASGADTSSRRAVHRSLLALDFPCGPDRFQAERIGRGRARPDPGSSRYRRLPCAPNDVRPRRSRPVRRTPRTPAVARAHFHARHLHRDRHIAVADRLVRGPGVASLHVDPAGRRGVGEVRQRDRPGDRARIGGDVQQDVGLFGHERFG